MINRPHDQERELGRKKLMMKLPALRNQLRDAAGEQIEALFVAYERASSGRERVRLQMSAPSEWTADYDRISTELEEGVKSYLAGQRWDDFG